MDSTTALGKLSPVRCKLRIQRKRQSARTVVCGGSPTPGAEDAPKVGTQVSTRHLVVSCERQQGDVPGLLDGSREPPLVRGANSGQAAGHNLAALGHKPLQQTDIPVGNGVDLLGAELAHFLAAEKLAAS